MSVAAKVEVVSDPPLAGVTGPAYRWHCRFVPKTPPTGPGRDAIDQWLAANRMPSIEDLGRAVTAGVFADDAAPRPARRGLAQQLPEARDEASVLTVRVDLDGTKPIVWRRLAIRSDLTATELHGILQAAMGGSDGHLHRFWVGPAKRLWTGPHLVNDLDEHEWDGDESRVVGHEDAVEVDQLLRRPGDRLFYTYDFGDGWDHSITVESVRSATDDDPPAVCLDGRRACPLEDCGGPGGHNEIVAALTAGTPLAEPLDTWVPPEWDPSEFDADSTTTALRIGSMTTEELMGLWESERGAVRTHDAVAELVERLDLRDVTAIAELTHAAMTGDRARETSDSEQLGPREVGALDTRAAVRPWQVLLSMAGEDGIPLTAAGWMRPAAVRDAFVALRLDATWFGKGNREDQTHPVAELRQIVVADRLLRKHKGRLVRTPAGRAADGDAAALWLVVARGLVPAGADSFERDVCILTLLHMAAGSRVGEAVWVEIAQVLTRAGWRTDLGQPVTSAQVWRTAFHVIDRLVWATGSWQGHLLGVTTPTQRALARAAVFPLS